MAKPHVEPTGLPDLFDVGYTRVVGVGEEDGPVLRCGMHPQSLITRPKTPGGGKGQINNIQDCFALGGLAHRPTAPCFGNRLRDDGTVGPFEWQSYLQVAARIDAVAAALWSKNLVPRAEGGHRFIGMYCKNSRDWMVVAEACYKTGVVVVPMYDTLGPETVSYIQNQTGAATVLCTATEMPKLLGSCPFAHVIVAGPLSNSLRAKATAAGLDIHPLAQLEQHGKQNASALNGVPSPGYEDLALLCYTSGTTGDPKGAMLSHGNIVSAVGSQLLDGISPFARDDLFSLPQEVYLSYLPLAHIFETVVMNLMILIGGAVGFYQGDTLKVIEDLTALRPTIFVSVPRLFNKIYDKVISGADAKGGLARALFRRALSTKLANLKASGTVTHGLWDKLVFAKVRASVGLDRCTYMLTGSAPISSSVKDFMRVAFGCLMLEGYGMTESATAGTICHPDDMTNGHVGMPSPAVEVKLRDVSEMGYLANASTPRGEICMRGPAIFKGYFQAPDKTAEAMSEDGWLYTGDIGEWSASGTLKIIDRKKNISKLAQGEYVAAEKIENVIARCPLVAQAFVYGDSLQSWLVALVVPEPEEVAKWATQQGWPFTMNPSSATAGDVEKILDTHGAALHDAILAQTTAACMASKLAGFEVPRRLGLDAQPWTPDNGLLTPTFKLKRNEAKKKYEPLIEKLYAAGPASIKLQSRL